MLVDAGPWLPVPPAGYGGIETVVATLVPELRRLGVRVVLAAVGGSALEADGRVTTLPHGQLERVTAPYNRSSGVAHAHMQAVVAALRADPSIDLVHDHLEVVGPAVLAAMGEAAPPVLQTLHWDLRKHREFYETFDGRGRVFFAGVSDSQVERAPLNLRRQVLASVPLAVPPPLPLPAPRRSGEPYALVLARVTRDKGQDLAARACRRAGRRLVLAGPVAGVDDPAELARRLADPADPLQGDPDAAYWREEVAPLVDGDRVRWVGGVAGEEKERLLQGADALLTPVRWAEPGATGVVEALVRGVPVVATPLGVLPSLVEDGVNGFLADDEEGLAAALRRVGSLDPARVRASADRWTPEAMARSYLALYRRVLALAGPRREDLTASSR
ncbi:glycosyltransferase [Vallicoccus soli]|uniref:Glycosyltransferase n=1 Tax=Vallicoccus soli TaxID=2339232 RepID=A0A3A3Z0J2_9ACTN|nr:glycosyltransferase [Vallicoccus soli]